MNLKDKINTLASSIFKEVVENRRHLHAHPELSMQEKETAAFICRYLDKMGIPYKKFDAHYGVVALIEGMDAGKKVVALRADMDALPITEESSRPYKSQKDGVMHACGHDVHMASLLGVAHVLNQVKDEFCGTVKLIFQPSEEMYPGGASMMIKDGVLQNPDVDSVIGQHVDPSIDSGKIGLKAGMAMASTDEVYITVKGKGGHAATPELITDPIVTAAQILTALQQIVSRKASPKTPTVLSFGRFIANGQMNIIPDEASLEGTIRTFDEKWRAEAHLLIKNIAQSVAGALGACAEVNIKKGYPALYNNETLTQRCVKVAQEVLGAENVLEIDRRMTAEDFSYFAQLKPSCFYRLGVKSKNQNSKSNLHTATFDIDEEALLTAVRLMSELTIEELKA